MKIIQAATLGIVLLMESCLLHADSDTNQTIIKWETDFEEAAKQAVETSKYMLVYFSGPDWCGRCTKFDEEVFESQDFIKNSASRFIFYLADQSQEHGPMLSRSTFNNELQHKFQVRSFPTLVIFDAQRKLNIGMMGYYGEGKTFADHLNRIVNDYNKYQQQLTDLEHGDINGRELKWLYKKSKELRFTSHTAKIMQKGIQSEEALFFLLERYRMLADNDMLHSKEAIALRHQLLKADPHNKKQIPYHIALIEFENSTAEMESDQIGPDAAAAPLITYIDRYGNKDKDNTWRLMILISQVYLDKNQLGAALKYAQESYDLAPSGAKPEISAAIKNIRSLR